MKKIRSQCYRDDWQKKNPYEKGLYSYELNYIISLKDRICTLDYHLSSYDSEYGKEDAIEREIIDYVDIAEKIERTYRQRF